MKPVLSAGVQYRLQCMAAGGRPAPQISWYRGDKLLEEAAGSPVVRLSFFYCRAGWSSASVFLMNENLETVGFIRKIQRK